MLQGQNRKNGEYTVLWSWLGRVDYSEAMSMMEDIAAKTSCPRKPGMLLFLEHPPTITLGKRAGYEDIIAPLSCLKARNYAVYRADRGGGATCHGPGQLVGYLVSNLDRLAAGARELVRGVEETLIRLLSKCGVNGYRMESHPGVWVEGEKIAALGMRIKGKVTGHGFALNINFDLDSYRLVVPCGMRHPKVTNLSRHTRPALAMPTVAVWVAEAFEEVFGVEMKKVDPNFVDVYRRDGVHIAGKGEAA